MEFSPYTLDDFDDVLALLQDAFDDPRQAGNFSAIGKFEDDSSYKRFVVRSSGRPVAYLGVGLRNVNYADAILRMGTIGPVAVTPRSQGGGVGKTLMRETLHFLEQAGLDGAYIQGIPHYYQKFGFSKYLDKAKIVVSTNGADEAIAKNVSVEPNCRDQDVFSGLYSNYSHEVAFAARRNAVDWDWLLGPGSNSYYFYKPKVFFDSEGMAIAYVCDDAEIANSPREIVTSSDPVQANIAITAIKDHYASLGCPQVEFKVPPNSLVSGLLEQEPCQKITYANPHGGDLCLFFDEYAVAQKLQHALSDIAARPALAFQAEVRCKKFSIRLESDGTDSTCELSPNSVGDGVSLVTAMAMRLSDAEANAHTTACGLGSYKDIQALMVRRLSPFIFQGDNM